LACAINEEAGGVVVSDICPAISRHMPKGLRAVRPTPPSRRIICLRSSACRPGSARRATAADIVERQKPGRFLVGLVVISWIITFFHGFDSNVIDYVAPYLSTQYHLSPEDHDPPHFHVRAPDFEAKRGNLYAALENPEDFVGGMHIIPHGFGLSWPNELEFSADSLRYRAFPAEAIPGIGRRDQRNDK
jgi:hypothetical protein